MVRPVGSRFIPTKLGLVRLYLRNMVERNESRFIKTMNVYENEPWRLDHDSNPLFKKNEWYYFVPRTKRGGKTASRIVRGSGESEGGTWKSTGVKKDIKDGRNNMVVGYKQSLVFNKKVNGAKPKKTNWLMTEFSLHKDGDEFQDLVLCWIRYKKDKKANLLGFNDPPRLEGEHGDLDYANELERTLLEEEDQQREQQNTTILPPVPSPQGQDSGFQTIMTTMKSNGNDFVMQSNDNDFVMQSNDDNFLMQSNEDNFLMQSNEDNFLMQSNEDNFLTQSNDNNFLLQSNEDNFLMQSSEINVLSLLTQSNDNNFLTRSNDNNVNNFLSQNNENSFLMQSNDDNLMMSSHEQYRLDSFGFDGAEDVMLDIDEMMQLMNDYTRQQEDQLQLLPN